MSISQGRIRGVRILLALAIALGLSSLLLSVTLFVLGSPLPIDYPRVRPLGREIGLLGGAGFLLALTLARRVEASAVVLCFFCGGAALVMTTWGPGFPFSHRHMGGRSVRPGVEQVQAAQMAYRAANAGYFDSRLGCLRAPWDCIPGYARDGKPMLSDQILMRSTARWYRWQLHAVPPPLPVPKQASASSCVAFAYTAVPTDPAYTGSEAYCADSLGALCIRWDGLPPAIQPDGTCDLTSCTNLR